MDQEDAKYTCTLDEESLKVAKEELYEEPKDRLSSVATLRKWLQEQPHLHSWTDTAILLMYLRGAKFSQLRARELIQNTLEMATKIPDWLQNLDPTEKAIQEYLNAGYYLPLPKRDKLKRRIMLIRQAAVTTKNQHYCLKNQMRAGMAVDRLLREEELTQVHGFILVFDFTGFSLKYMKEWTPENSKKQMKVYQDALPGRVKGMHFYNAGAIFETLFAISKPFIKKKFIDRIKVHSTLESLYKDVPMELLPDEYLPDDYTGPRIGSVKTLIADLKAELMRPEYRQHMKEVSSSKYCIDLQKRPDDTQNASSFRRISVD